VSPPAVSECGSTRSAHSVAFPSHRWHNVLVVPPDGSRRSASAPVKAFEPKGASPFRANVTSPNPTMVTASFARKGGEQPEENDQSVTQVNLIRPSLSGSWLATANPPPRDGTPFDPLGLPGG
jgi:hypothetical protein